MKKEQLKKFYDQTGEVVRKTAKIEMILAQIISAYYFNKIDKIFIHDVLKNELSSFGLIRDILERVLLNYEIDRKVINELNKKLRDLGKLRNIFAHEQILFNKLTPDIIWFADGKKKPWREEGKNTDELFKTFNNLYIEIKKELEKIITKLKIKTNYIDIEI